MPDALGSKYEEKVSRMNQSTFTLYCMLSSKRGRRENLTDVDITKVYKITPFPASVHILTGSSLSQNKVRVNGPIIIVNEY